MKNRTIIKNVYISFLLGLIDYFIVNNGWGQNGININAGYSDGTIVI